MQRDRKKWRRQHGIKLHSSLHFCRCHTRRNIILQRNRDGKTPAKKTIEAQKKPSQKFQWFPFKIPLAFSNQNQIKSLLLSHHHITSALVREILTSVLQTVQKKNNLHMDSMYLQTVQKTVQNTHTYTQYTQCTIKTYSVTNTHYTPYVHYLYIMYTSIHSNNVRCNRLSFTVDWLCNR